MQQMIPTNQRVIAVLWPSFLTAGLATVLYFLVFDPEELVRAGIIADISRLGAYTILAAHGGVVPVDVLLPAAVRTSLMSHGRTRCRAADS